MKRRDFLKYGTAAGTAVLVGGELTADASQLPPEEMAAYLARMDRHMADLSRQRTLNDLLPNAPRPEGEGEREVHRRGDELFRKSLRTLLLVGLMHDLPEESRRHPEMQKRLGDAMPEMDDAVFGILGMLRSYTPAERIDLASTIEADPELPMRIVEAIDREGASLGISRKRRAHLRAIATQVVWRFRHQSPWAVVDECVDKAERVASRVASREEVQRRVAAVQAEETFWRRRADLVAQEVPLHDPPADAPAPTPPPTAAPAPTATPDTAPVPPPAEPVYTRPPTYSSIAYSSNPNPSTSTTGSTGHRSTGKELMQVGGILMGVGVTVGGVFTLLTVSYSILFAFGITAGAILLVVGLIILIVGAARDS